MTKSKLITIIALFIGCVDADSMSDGQPNIADEDVQFVTVGVFNKSANKLMAASASIVFGAALMSLL